MDEFFRRAAVTGLHDARVKPEGLDPSRAELAGEARLRLEDCTRDQRAERCSEQARWMRDEDPQVRSCPNPLESSQGDGVEEGVARDPRMGKDRAAAQQVSELHVALAARGQFEKPGKEPRPASREQNRGERGAAAHGRDNGRLWQCTLHRLPEAGLPETSRSAPGEHDRVDVDLPRSACAPDAGRGPVRGLVPGGEASERIHGGPLRPFADSRPPAGSACGQIARRSCGCMRSRMRLRSRPRRAQACSAVRVPRR